VKLKNTQKQGFPFCRVRTKIKAIVYIIPQNIVKQVQVLRKLSSIREYDLINYKIHRYILHASVANLESWPGEGAMLHEMEDILFDLLIVIALHVYLSPRYDDKLNSTFNLL
jgi:hypothetical protein